METGKRKKKRQRERTISNLKSSPSVRDTSKVTKTHTKKKKEKKLILS